jgi:hypothetical protein
MPEQGKLEKPWVRLPLMRALAAGEKTQTALAAEYGATQPSVSDFARRHADEITALREKLDDEWAGLWVATKRNRLAVYQESIERISGALEKFWESYEGEPTESTLTEDGKLTTVQAKLLRQVAEEVGDLRQDVNVTGQMLHHVIEGVDLGDLE